MKFGSVWSVGVVILIGCSQHSPLRKPLQPTPANSSAEQGQLLVLPDQQDRDALISESKELGLEVHGNTILSIRGSRDAIAELSIPESSKTEAVWDQVAFAKTDASEAQSSLPSARSMDPSEAPSGIGMDHLYMGSAAFGIPEYLKENPTHDGRGIIVGVLDDGISPHQSGLTVTSTGQRKVLAIAEATRLYRVALQPVANTGLRFSQQLTQATQTFKGIIASDLISQVRKVTPGTDIPSDFDLNLDGKDSQIEIEVGRVGENFIVCIDRNADGAPEADECQGTFEATGDVRFWDAKKRYALTVEVDPKATSWVHLTSGERLGDSHGEGVASVLSAYKMGGTFDGVAPGSQLVSYETSFSAFRPEDLSLTLGQFLEGLDWLGSKGAKVINYSSYTYLSTAGTQAFLTQALRRLNQKYNFVLTVAAGNDGPGLNSNYERSAYPENSLLIGAYLDPVQDESVYGNSRSKSHPGRPMWFSSIGPGFDGGQSIDCISPLAALGLQDPDSGIGW
ncbi:MAG: S8 family serine peptidase, partial [Bdellovibrionales bacterium]|nr:S8 family serine peptidase [Bdellovibrionales bacterium]